MHLQVQFCWFWGSAGEVQSRPRSASRGKGIGNGVQREGIADTPGTIETGIVDSRYE